ncbi:Lon protease family protein [Thiococcus pfennigii]|uniref:Lon protease family protein n=1 Tax=Thiococcus pfennigii TaxID=1057 RepID=UPI0019056905|nr:ATP-binding protein [Thiococcus pfennigii]MBK1701899.1 ATP-dependent protease [Thiococcus pfennigii]
MPVTPLSPNALYRRCDPDQLGFATTAELEAGDALIPQERARHTIEFGIGIRHSGYNLFALGPSGTGKLALIRRTLEERATAEPVPSDWCYVFNFANAHRPRALRLPPGRGNTLRRDMEQLVTDLHRAIPGVFESDEYRTRSQALEEELEERQEQAMGALREMAKEKDVVLLQTPTGFTLAPIRNGKPLGPEEFHALPKKEQTRIEADIDALQAEMRKVMHQMPVWKKRSDEQIEELNREMAGGAVRSLIETLGERYQDLPAVVAYLDEVQADVVEHFRQFLPTQDKQPPFLAGWTPPNGDGPPWHHRYRINVLLGHDQNGGAPVVYADLPAHHQLVGRIEHRAHLGALETDFTMIRAGALHEANGGYLILDALKLLLQPFAWETLKRLLQAGEIRIESLAQITSLISTLSLEPEPIPLDVKVVMLGERHIYYLLCQLDPEFRELFKVAVDFDDELVRDPASALGYARFVAAEVHRAALRPFEAAAVAHVVEHGARLVDDNERLTSHMRSIGDLLREADYWAGASDHALVTAADVEQAIRARIERADRIARRLREETTRGTILIDTDGERIGQVNGLAVMALGDFAFGHPSRITARVRLGKGEVIDIEREVKLGGPLHTKGVLILQGFIAGRYALEHPLSLSASLVFEQTYGGVDGDSASSAELYALLSALAELPIRQSLAVTGSVNQRGEIQAIGGVNEKIEGFYDTCAARGPVTGQGVLIPAANVKHLMLRADVREAAAAGRFAIYPVTTVDEGIELLTGMPAGTRGADGRWSPGSVNARVEARLVGFSERLRALRGGDTQAPPTAEPPR